MRRATGLALLLAVLAATACSGSSATGGAGGDGNGNRDAPTGSITVLAAASLTDAFTELGRLFTTSHPGTDVRFSFDASSTLVRQAVNGAPADVLATADEVTMQQARDAGVVSEPRIFARNRLAILVARGNPRRIASLSDLARSDVVVVLCAPDVPCGRSGAQALQRAGVRVEPRSLEPNVRGVVAKITLGEADAGIVYRTDVLAADSAADGVAIPDRLNVVARYPIAALSDAPNPSGAAAFVAFVRAAPGRAILEAHGFGVP